MKCRNCGADLTPNAQFCKACGTKTQEEMLRNDKKNSLNPTVLIVAITVVILAIIAAVVFLLTRTSEVPPTTSVTATPDPIVEIIEPTPASPVSPAPTATEETISSVMYVINCNNFVTLRTAPSISADEIVKIPLGQSVGFISHAENDFYKVSYNGRTGYVLSAYLGYTPENRQTGSWMQVVNCKEWISLRNAPSTDATKIISVPLGAWVEFLSPAANGFYKINYNGYIGYALATYLQ